MASTIQYFLQVTSIGLLRMWQNQLLACLCLVHFSLDIRRWALFDVKISYDSWKYSSTNKIDMVLWFFRQSMIGTIERLMQLMNLIVQFRLVQYLRMRYVIKLHCFHIKYFVIETHFSFFSSFSKKNSLRWLPRSGCFFWQALA